MGGYTTLGSLLDLLGSSSALFDTISVIVNNLFVTSATSILVLLLFFALLLLNFRRFNTNTTVGLIVGAAGAILPLIALLPLISMGVVIQRWFFVPTIVLLLFFAYLCSITPSSVIRGIVISALLGVSILAIYTRGIHPDPPQVVNESVGKKTLNSWCCWACFSCNSFCFCWWS